MNWTVQTPTRTTVTSYQTLHRHQFIDITDDLPFEPEGEGQLLVFSRHTTAAVIINEKEPLLLQDLSRCLDRLASPGARYDHDDLTRRTVNLVPDEPANGHAHCQHLALGCSVTIPVLEGRLLLGRWQRIFLVELDSPRTREVVFQYRC